MIDVKELRLGNWLLDTQGNEFINVGHLLQSNFHATCINGKYIGFFEPILLTPEILEKFFKGKEFIELESGIILCDDIDSILLHAEDISNLIQYKLVHVKYLHQLQNLYFALTGEELEINL